jgi:hypothetical protein
MVIPITGLTLFSQSGTGAKSTVFLSGGVDGGS